MRWRIAEKTSERVAIATAGVSRAEGGRQLARSERMPQLNGAASYDRTLKSEFEGLFDDGRRAGSGGGDSDVDFSNLPFGQANVYRLGLVVLAGALCRRDASRRRSGRPRFGRDNAAADVTSAKRRIPWTSPRRSTTPR